MKSLKNNKVDLKFYKLIYKAKKKTVAKNLLTVLEKHSMFHHTFETVSFTTMCLRAGVHPEIFKWGV